MKISIFGALFIVLAMAMIGTATTDDRMKLSDAEQKIQDNMQNVQEDLQNLQDIDMSKIAEEVKKVDYNKLSKIKPEDFPVTTEDVITGMGRVDYVHYGIIDNKNSPVKDSNRYLLFTSTCYKTFAKWPTLPVNYVINTTSSNGQSLTASSIFTSAEIWDEATSKELFNNNYVVDNHASESGTFDGRNVIDMGHYDDPGVIAVTSIWYNMYLRRIYEFDIRFNDAFAWGDATSSSGVMDRQNIATHELGHGVGLDDLYTYTCRDATMFGYSGYGETKKRTLETGDKRGLWKLYGQ